MHPALCACACAHPPPCEYHVSPYAWASDTHPMHTHTGPMRCLCGTGAQAVEPRTFPASHVERTALPASKPFTPTASRAHGPASIPFTPAASRAGAGARAADVCRATGPDASCTLPRPLRSAPLAAVALPLPYRRPAPAPPAPPAPPAVHPRPPPTTSATVDASAAPTLLCALRSRGHERRGHEHAHDASPLQLSRV